jgi:DNA-directed RNA polymerase subunit RPC12/RpoP
MKPYRGPPATLGTTAAAQARKVVWCRDCRHRVEPDPAELARRHGAETSVLDWDQRLVCSKCGSRAVDFVLTGGGQ